MAIDFLAMTLRLSSNCRLAHQIQVHRQGWQDDGYEHRANGGEATLTSIVSRWTIFCMSFTGIDTR